MTNFYIRPIGDDHPWAAEVGEQCQETPPFKNLVCGLPATIAIDYDDDDGNVFAAGLTCGDLSHVNARVEAVKASLGKVPAGY